MIKTNTAIKARQILAWIRKKIVTVTIIQTKLFQFEIELFLNFDALKSD